MANQTRNGPIARQQTGTADDYPFDPRLERNVDELVGLERLRAIRDRAVAHHLHELWVHIERNGSDIEHNIRRTEAARARAELVELRQLAASTMRGAYGLEAQELARDITQRGADQSRGCLEHLRAEMRRAGYRRV